MPLNLQDIHVRDYAPKLRPWEETVDGIVLTHMDRVKSKALQWLWKNFFPRGKISLFAGEQGLGKSYGTIDLAARASRAWGWPDGADPLPKPTGTLFVAGEDGIRDTVKARLDSSKADLSLIKVASGVYRSDGRGQMEMVDLTQDLDRFDTILDTYPFIKDVVIDPITGYMGRGNDPNSEADVRRALTPLALWAERRNVGVKIIAHLNKNRAQKALHRVSGSVAFTAVSRICYLLTADPEDAKRRFFIPFKWNIDADPKPLAYKNVAGVLRWERDPVIVTADLAVDGKKEKPPRKDRTTALIQAKDILLAELTKGPKEATELLRLATLAGVGERTFREAKAQLGVMTTRHQENGRVCWIWKLAP